MGIGVLYNSIATVRVVAAGNSSQFIAMNRAITAHRVRPVLDRTFAFAEPPAAFRYFDARRPFGKVVIAHD